MEHDFSNAYDQFAEEYDQWFARHSIFYESELLAIRKVIPEHKEGIEIGVGTGRFASRLNIKTGVEPSESMATIARNRGINIIIAKAEDIPLPNQGFGFALMVTTDCFLNDIPKSFSEVNRMLEPGGEFIVAHIDRNGNIGKKYQSGKENNKFYTGTHFHSPEEITQFLSGAGFGNFAYWQTLFAGEEKEIELPQPGFGRGSFVVIRAVKK